MTPEFLSYDEARARVLAAATPGPIETLPLERSAGRVLRRPLTATHDLPPFRNSAMDGYAVRTADLATASAAAPVTLRVVAAVPAGHAPPARLGPGEAVRIMTGAEPPPGADAVVPFEECERLAVAGDERVRIGRPPAPADHLRDAGADVRAGDRVLPAGRTLSAHDLALAGALGVALLEVACAPRAVVLSTGDELVALDAPLRAGAIRDSNRPMLAMLLAEAGAEVVRTEHLPDDPTVVAERIRAALRDADVVLTVGGVSAGDFDPVKLALDDVGGVSLWRVAMRPGRPQAFGAVDGRLFFGLPGNPGSVACVFEALVRPALRARQGATALDRPGVPARAATRIESRTGRVDFVRVELAWRDGLAWATPAGAQVSGHLGPQSRAHGLLVVPAACAALESGDAAEVRIWRLPDAGAGD